jgi:formylglycine-generating enzyme required for sulfatase activity
METNPSPSVFKGDNLPVVSVSWDDVQQFIKKLNEKEGTNKYRLPSEAEWEYAAHAGTTTRYSFGDDESMLVDYAWYDANSGNKTHEVGQKKPNPWGLYDIYGNVWEWVQDKYHDSYNGAPIDGSAWEGDGSVPMAPTGSVVAVAGATSPETTPEAAGQRFASPRTLSWTAASSAFVFSGFRSRFPLYLEC